MPRVKLTEYSAKRIARQYGFSLPESTTFHSGDTIATIALPSADRYIVKVDQGVKGRMKKGLLAGPLPASDAASVAQSFFDKGFERVLIEAYLSHDEQEEKYLSLERTRAGVVARMSLAGGIEIETAKNTVASCILDSEGIEKVAQFFSVPVMLIDTLLSMFHECHFSFLETNPLLVRDQSFIFLDLAVLADSAAEYFCMNRWSADDCVSVRGTTEEERAVHALNASSQASFALSVLKPNGSIFLMLSGGGASIVVADELCALGLSSELANYGEYSGNPSEDETFEYALQILSLLKKSNAPHKVLLIAGGVANFTNIKTTFRGIIHALDREREYLATHSLALYVRRGGPGQDDALASMRDFLSSHSLDGTVSGPETSLDTFVKQAVSSYAIA